MEIFSKCSECGVSFQEARIDSGDVEIFDAIHNEWTSGCPNCGAPGTFEDEDGYDIRQTLEYPEYEEDLDAGEEE